MEELSLRPDGRELLRTINSPEGMEVPPKPFERDIYLISLMVAGTAYAQNIDALFRSLKEGDLLRLVREPENPYDEYAIRVETADAETIGYCALSALVPPDEDKLGYIPRMNNKIIARLMDAGKLIYGKVREKKIVNDKYYNICIRVYMKD